MAFKDTSSQNAATVRMIGYKAGQNYRETVRKWQQNYNRSLPKSAPKIKEDGLVGDETRKAMGNTAGPNSGQDFTSKGQVNTRARKTTKEDRIRAGASHAELAQELARRTRDRATAANRNLSYTKAGEKTETLYERMKGDPAWAAKYRKEQAEKRNGTRPVSSPRGNVEYTERGRPIGSKPYKSEKATTRNLRPWERSQISSKFQQSVVSGKRGAAVPTKTAAQLAAARKLAAQREMTMTERIRAKRKYKQTHK